MALAEDLVQVHIVGLGGQTVAMLTEDPKQTVLAVKRRLSDQVGLSCTRLALIFGGLELPDEATLQSSGVSQDPTVYVIFGQPRQALTGSEDGLQLWDLDSCSCLRSFKCTGSMVKAVAVDWMAMRAVSGAEDHLLQLWDLNTGDKLQTFLGHKGAVTAVDVDWSSGQMLSGSLDACIILWDLETGTCLRNFGSGAGVRALNADWTAGMVLLSRATLVQLWAVASEHRLQNCPGHEGQVLSVAVNWVEKQAISAATDCTLRTWCLVTGECLQIIVIKTDIKTWQCNYGGDGIWTISVDWQDKLVLIGSQDGSMQLWDLCNGKPVRIFEGKHGPVQTLTVDWIGKQALSSGTDRHLRLWDLDTGRCMSTLEKSAAPTKALVASW